MIGSLRAAFALGFCIVAAAAGGASAAPQRAPKPAAQPAQPTGPSVCVASMIGQKFNIQTIGLMVFGNSLQTAAIDSWRIDDVAVAKVASLLKGMTVRRIAFSPAALAAYETRQPGDLFRRNLQAEFMGMLQTAAAAAPKCNYYMVIERLEGAYSNTNQRIAGLGVLNHDTGLFARRWVFASISPRLFDGNFELIRPSITADDIGAALVSSLTSDGVRAPHREIDQSQWPASPQAAVQSAFLRETSKQLVEQALAKYVPRLFSNTAAAQ